MDTHALKLFLHLAQTLHFAKTGQACHISPSALSRQIQRMESELGRRLFERDNRSVRLTRAGERFQKYAQASLERWQALLNELAQANDTLIGEISLYCSVTASLGILPDLLSAFRAAHPQVQIRLQTGDAAEAIGKVVAEEADIAVAALPDRPPKSLAFKELTQISLSFVAPRINWAFAHVPVKNLPWEQVPMILTERGRARMRVERWFRQKQVRPHIYAQVAGNEAILSMVGLGCGVGVVPDLAIGTSALQDRIAILDVKPGLAPYDVGICVQKRKLQNRLVRTFWETVTSVDGGS